ncbi:MAG: ArsB/NhaD family transporter [Thermoplasmata archaeon]
MYDQLLAVGIMGLVYALIVSERVHRTTAILLGAVLVLGLGVLTIDEAVAYVNWEALGLIFGMFILVAALTESGFFRWIGLHALRAAKFRAGRVFLLFCGLAAVLSAFMDSITVMIFMGSLALEVSRVLKVHPIPFLLGLITSANIGGSATMVGDPPNVIIGTALHLGFADFVVNVGPVALAVFAVNAGFFYLYYRRKEFDRPPSLAEEDLAKHRELDPFSAIKDLRLLRVSLTVFAFTVTLLVLHQLLDLVVAFVALLGATLVLIFGGKDMPELVTKIDWHTLLFLGGLFVIVGGLEKTGVLSDAARALGSVSGGNVALLLTLILWSSALLSMVLDNIPFAAAMVPVIRDLSLQNGIPLPHLAWSLALGTDIGGNGTPIGASANVVGLAVGEKGGVHVSWPEYLRVALPATLLSLAAANLLLLIRFA